MIGEKNYRIRRGIVYALFEYKGPQDIGTVAIHQSVAMHRPPPELLRREWDNLASLGLIVLLGEYGGEVAKLAAPIRTQMDQNGSVLPQIPELYGAQVL